LHHADASTRHNVIVIVVVMKYIFAVYSWIVNLVVKALAVDIVIELSTADTTLPDVRCGTQEDVDGQPSLSLAKVKQ